MRNPDWLPDEALLLLELYLRRGRRALQASDSDVVELSDVLNRLTLHPLAARTPTFRNPAGISMKIANLRSLDPEASGSALSAASDIDRVTWYAFAHRYEDLRALTDLIRAAASSGSARLGEADEGFFEGRVFESWHKRRERNRALVEAKVSREMAMHGRLRCEACEFDFEGMYGNLGRGYIECHHRVPLAQSGERESYVEDLALLCANCHRMIHRSGCQHPMMAVDELRDLIAEHRSVGLQGS